MGSQPHADSSNDLRREVLSSFECPLDCDQYDQFILMVTDCPFGHPSHLANTETALRKIPSYLCVEHLMNRCSGPQSTVTNGLIRCNTNNKFHALFEELIDLDYFIEKMAAAALALPSIGALSGDQASQANPFPSTSGVPQEKSQRKGRKRAKPEEDAEEPIECSICFGNVRPNKDQFGLLDKCAHHFCATCIIDWFVRPSSEQSCPICRRRSTRIVVWSKPALTHKEKKKIFKLQEKATKAGTTGAPDEPPTI